MNGSNAQLNILAAVPVNTVARYKQNLEEGNPFKLTVVTDLDNARKTLDEIGKQTDVFVVDNSLGNTFKLVKEIRHTFPRLIIILVDEEADFALPGRADDISTAPFENNDLITRIKRLNEDRRLQTLRADALPPVRQFAKSILKAGKNKSRQQAAVEAVKELGYDYVAFYSLSRGDVPSLILVAQSGDDSLTSAAPKKPDYNDSLVGWVAQNGQSRTVSADDTPNHPFLQSGKFPKGVCVPVGNNLRFGVLFACKSDSISGEQVMMLELVSAQLASALAKEERT